MTKKLYVKRIENGEVVKEIETTESRHEKVMMGLLRNMNTDRFYIDDSEFNEE